MALTSDAGTPVISDPGSLLVKSCVSHSKNEYSSDNYTVDIPVTPIPGANAGILSLISSGLYSSPFVFYGFIKRSGKDRKNM